jgi:hypothetical protein
MPLMLADAYADIVANVVASVVVATFIDVVDHTDDDFVLLLMLVFLLLYSGQADWRCEAFNIQHRAKLLFAQAPYWRQACRD